MTVHNPEDIEALASRVDENTKLGPYGKTWAPPTWGECEQIIGALQRYAALLREREMEERLLKAGWFMQFSPTPSYFWGRGGSAQYARHSERAEAARLALEKMEGKG